jgi:flagellar export protein FliJ
MAFHFPLEAVLHFRKSLEHQQELRLRAANQQVARARHLIEQLDHAISRLRNREAQALGAGTSAAELRFGLEREAELRQHRHNLESELARLETQRDQQQKLFRQARRERETFESLRDHQLREYERNSARRQQRELDALFLLRQAYLLRQSGLRRG